jgi:hypothetical protein
MPPVWLAIGKNGGSTSTILELRWLLDRNIRRLLAFQDFVDEIGRAPIGAG